MRLFDRTAFGELPADGQTGADLALQGDARLRFADVADRDAVRCEALRDKATGRAALSIDPEACRKPVCLIVVLPHVSAALASHATMEASLRVRMEMIVGAGDARTPVQSVSLIEGEDASARVVSRAGGIRIGRRWANHLWKITIPPASHRFGMLRVKVMIRPGARPLVIREIGAVATSLALPGVFFEVRGRRPRGSAPENRAPFALRISGDDRPPFTISVDEPDFDFGQAEPIVRFEGDLTDRLLTPCDDGHLPQSRGLVELLSAGAAIAFAPLRPQVDPTDATAGARTPVPNSSALDAILALVRADHRNAALVALDGFSPPTPREQRIAAQMRARTLFKLRRFDDLVALFGDLSAELRDDPAIRARYVEASISLGDLDAARRTIEEAIVSDAPEPAAAGLLADLSP